MTRYGLNNWEHLTVQMNRLEERVFSVDDVDAATKEADWSCFVTLNSMIAEEIVERVVSVGFDLVRLYKTREEKSPPARIAGIYSDEALMTNQMVALFRKVPASE